MGREASECGCMRWCRGMIKKKEERAQLQEKVTDELEKEGGARDLSLEHSVSSIGWWAWVTDHRPWRELGSQHAAEVVGQQAVVIWLISCTAASSSAHRQILIGKISWDELQESCTLSDSCAISYSFEKLSGKNIVGLYECYSMRHNETYCNTHKNPACPETDRFTFVLHMSLQWVLLGIHLRLLSPILWAFGTTKRNLTVMGTLLIWQHNKASCYSGMAWKGWCGNTDVFGVVTNERKRGLVVSWSCQSTGSIQ